MIPSVLPISLEYYKESTGGTFGSLGIEIRLETHDTTVVPFVMRALSVVGVLFIAFWSFVLVSHFIESKHPREITWKWDEKEVNEQIQNFRFSKDFLWGVSTAAHQG